MTKYSELQPLKRTTNRDGTGRRNSKNTVTYLVEFKDRWVDTTLFFYSNKLIIGFLLDTYQK